jgi:hypothetical protein
VGSALSFGFGMVAITQPPANRSGELTANALIT